MLPKEIMLTSKKVRKVQQSVDKSYINNDSVLSNSCIYPHLVYTLDFGHSNASFRKDVWQSRTKEGILARIAKQSNEKDDVGKPVKEVKVVVVVELPYGGGGGSGEVLCRRE